MPFNSKLEVFMSLNRYHYTEKKRIAFMDKILVYSNIGLVYPDTEVFSWQN